MNQVNQEDKLKEACSQVGGEAWKKAIYINLKHLEKWSSFFRSSARSIY